MGKPKIYPRVPKIQEDREFLVRDRGNGLKIRPVVYRWTNGVGWVIPANYEVMKMKAINHKPMIRLREPSLFRTGRRSDPALILC